MASVYDYSQATDILSVISDGSNSDDDEVRFWKSLGSDIFSGRFEIFLRPAHVDTILNGSSESDESNTNVLISQYVIMRGISDAYMNDPPLIFPGNIDYVT